MMASAGQGEPVQLDAPAFRTAEASSVSETQAASERDGKTRQVPVLDGLRGLAVLIVLLSHLANTGMELMPGIDLRGIGKSGVYLFFVLSAFLLSRAILDADATRWRLPGYWLDYILRRILRIWPLYLLVLVSGLAIAGLKPDLRWYYQLDAAAFWRHVGLQEGRGVLWSIPVEFKYYILLPFVALGLAWLRVRRLPFYIDMLCVFGLIAVASTIWPPGDTVENDIRLGPYLPIFLCGALAAAYQSRMDLSAITRRQHWLWPCLAAFVAIAWLGSVPSVWTMLTGVSAPYSLSHRWFLFYGIIWALLLLALLNGPAVVRRLFELPPMRGMGVISFSAYLWHMPVIEGMHTIGWEGGWWSGWVALLLAVAVSTLSYLVVERPMRGVRWPKRR